MLALSTLPNPLKIWKNQLECLKKQKNLLQSDSEEAKNEFQQLDLFAVLNDSVSSQIAYFFKKMGQTRPLFLLFLVFSSKQYNFLQQINVKISIQYTALEFEPTTFWMWVVIHNH